MTLVTRVCISALCITGGQVFVTVVGQCHEQCPGLGLSADVVVSILALR